eukprot:10986877-Lingulodinium_polyedra.AAC.1
MVAPLTCSRPLAALPATAPWPLTLGAPGGPSDKGSGDRVMRVCITQTARSHVDQERHPAC